MSDPTKVNENLASSSYDQQRGQASAKNEKTSAATGPKDTVTGKVQETPEEPSDRPGTEAGEARR